MKGPNPLRDLGIALVPAALVIATELSGLLPDPKVRQELTRAFLQKYLFDHLYAYKSVLVPILGLLNAYVLFKFVDMRRARRGAPPIFDLRLGRRGRDLLLSIQAVLVRDKDARALIAEILVAHDEQIAKHPRLRWWILWCRVLTLFSLAWHLGVFSTWGRLLRGASKLVERFRPS